MIDEDLTYVGDDLPELALGRASVRDRAGPRGAAGEEETAWFDRHGSTPITEIPAHWPTDVPGARAAAARADRVRPVHPVAGGPEYKRRWAPSRGRSRQERALRGWLLDRLEDRRFWFDAQGRPTPRSVAQLADEVARDADLVSVLALWEGRPDVPVTQSLAELLADEAVPFLAAYRYKDSGLRKREAWEHTWELQRREDAGREGRDRSRCRRSTPSADFRKTSYWQARGKLDVPKERFILYPDAGRETDPTPLLGWAGWDHAQQALALALIIGEREQDGWADERLVPLVAGLAELQPWVEQWHAEIDPTLRRSAWRRSAGSSSTARAAQVGMTCDELAAWRPAAADARTARPRSRDMSDAAARRHRHPRARRGRGLRAAADRQRRPRARSPRTLDSYVVTPRSPRRSTRRSTWSPRR